MGKKAGYEMEYLARMADVFSMGISIRYVNAELVDAKGASGSGLRREKRLSRDHEP